MSKNGFSLLELIVVLSIIALTGFGFANFVSYRSASELDRATNEALQLVQHAHALATSNVVPTACTIDTLQQYEVVYDSGNDILKITSACGGDVSSPQINFATRYSGIEVTMNNITFSRYYGTSNAGTITLTSGSIHRTIGVTTNGEIKKQ